MVDIASEIKRLTVLPKYEAVRTTVEGHRVYATPLGYKPSVTTVLRDDSKFEGWRKWQGEQRATEILNRASARGTWTHDSAEHKLLTGKDPEFHFSYQPFYNSLRPFLEEIQKPLLLEGAIWNSDNYAGACDCIGYTAEDVDQPSLIDFKTANKPVEGSKLYGYEMQVAAYIKAANFTYRREGLCIKRGLIVVAMPNRVCQVHELRRNDINQLYCHFLEKLEDWHDKHKIPQNIALPTNNHVA
jgi:hypothetical protein